MELLFAFIIPIVSFRIMDRVTHSLGMEVEFFLLFLQLFGYLLMFNMMVLTFWMIMFIVKKWNDKVVEYLANQ